ncbi:hypothetical protein, partial [Escherichia coli]|uniref:hypothetical protein n=1 Tax=Escherichia coli TaxID=562 RepID=UPI003F686281
AGVRIGAPTGVACSVCPGGVTSGHPVNPLLGAKVLPGETDNRIARDAHYLYRYDRYGRLTEKTDLIPEGGIRTDDERTHRYHYDSQHRLVHYTRTQYAEPLVESRYLY